MSFTVDALDDIGCVCVVHFGNAALTELEESCSSAAELLNKLDYARLIVDMRRSEASTLYTLKPAQAAVLPPRTAIAMLVPPQALDVAKQKTAEDAGLERGIRMRRFADDGEAERWLVAR
jgi:hypothetical protein